MKREAVREADVRSLIYFDNCKTQRWARHCIDWDWRMMFIGVRGHSKPFWHTIVSAP
jgi:hypothetical protein